MLCPVCDGAADVVNFELDGVSDLFTCPRCEMQWRSDDEAAMLRGRAVSQDKMLALADIKIAELEKRIELLRGFA